MARTSTETQEVKVLLTWPSTFCEVDSENIRRPIVTTGHFGGKQTDINPRD